MCDRQFLFVEIDSEMCAGKRGAATGINALKSVARTKKQTTFKDIGSIEVTSYNECLDDQTDTPSAKYISTYGKVFSNIANDVSNSIKNSQFPIVLSADHANAAAVISGIKIADPNKKVGVIWIDAHADLHTPYTSPTGNIHGMPLSLAMGIDNIDKQRNQVSEYVAETWDSLQNYQTGKPKLSTDALFFFGLRDTEMEEDYLREKYNIPNITVEELRQMGVQKSVQKAKKHLEDCDLIYVSFDVDSMDSETVSDGTGTPVPNGFSLDESKKLVTTLLEQLEDQVCGFEITEINPLLDSNKNSMAEAAYEVLMSALGTLESKNKQLDLSYTD